MKRSVLINLIASCTLLLIACDSQPTVQTTAGSVGIANPASSYCIEQGGSLEIENQDDMQVGYCTLPNVASVLKNGNSIGNLSKLMNQLFNT